MKRKRGRKLFVKLNRKYEMIIILTLCFLVAASVFTIQQLNKVYNIKFEWYSQYSQAYMDEKRQTVTSGRSIDKIEKSELLDANAGIYVIGNRQEYDACLEELGDCGFEEKINADDLKDYIYIYGYLGEVYSLGFDIRFLDISQRQGVFEVLANITVPEQNDSRESWPDAAAAQESRQRMFVCEDVIRVSKKVFYMYPNVTFVFSNKSGAQVYRISCEIS